MLEKEKILVKTAASTDGQQLYKFYKIIFHDRYDMFAKHFNWLYRIDFNKNIDTLIIEYDKLVVAHSGNIPIALKIGNKTLQACWNVDFYILDGYQRNGLGGKLIANFEKKVDACLSFCNSKSIGTYKKAGWSELRNSAYLHIQFIRPANHPFIQSKIPKFVRPILNGIYASLTYLMNQFLVKNKAEIIFEKLDKASFTKFYNHYLSSINIDSHISSPLRDMAFANWRVLQSYNVKEYFVYHQKNFSAIVQIQHTTKKYINVLWVSDSQNILEIKNMMAFLNIWGVKNNSTCVRLLTTFQRVSSSVYKPLFSVIKKPIFTYYFKDSELKNDFDSSIKDFQLIDSDFEFLQ